MASREEVLSKIQALKRDLSRSGANQNDHADLTEARSALEKEIDRLKTKSEESDSKEDLLQECLAKQREIDHRLDDLEEWTDEEASRVREEMISLILEIHPDQKQNYEDLAKNYQELCDLDRLTTKTEQNVKQMIESIEEAQQVRGKVRKRGVLSYIIGRNPNVLIGKSLQNIHQIAEDMLKQIPDLSRNSAAPKNLKTLYGSLEKLLKDLSARTQGQWSFKTIDTTFTDAKENLELFLESHTLESKALRTKLKSSEIKLNDWIEKNSS